MQRVHLIPMPGLVVRNPADMSKLPPEGAELPLNKYWQRQLRDGAVSIQEPAPESLESKPEAAEPEFMPPPLARIFDEEGA